MDLTTGCEHFFPKQLFSGFFRTVKILDYNKNGRIWLLGQAFKLDLFKSAKRRGITGFRKYTLHYLYNKASKIYSTWKLSIEIPKILEYPDPHIVLGIVYRTTIIQLQ